MQIPLNTFDAHQNLDSCDLDWSTSQDATCPAQMMILFGEVKFRRNNVPKPQEHE